MAAATQLLAKGPLSSAIGQWAFLGFGTLVLLTGDNGVSRAAQQIAGVAFRLVTGTEMDSLLREAALGSRAVNAASALHNGHGQQQQQPIVIHSHAPSSSDGKYSGGWTVAVIRLTLASGACWGAYVVLANYLPDSIKEMMPVTRRFFESAVSSLGNGILRVRDVLSEQIAVLGTKQDELAAKQDETHGSVLGLKDDIGDVRLHIDDIAVAISRCEGSLTDAAGRQTYMSRGVRLLVQCVGDLLRPSDPAVAEELERFAQMSMGEGEENEGRGSASRHQLECPSSPNLSEIGSTTSASVDDRHHHHHHMRSLSLPRPRRDPQSVATPPFSSSTNPNDAPVSTSRMSLMGTPPKYRMLHSFNGNPTASATTSNSNNGSSSSKLPRSYSSPEDEVPQSNGLSSHSSSGRSTPMYGGGANDTRGGLELSELTELVGQMTPSGGGNVGGGVGTVRA